ncbi:MAG: TRAP transporter fused permease subunit, partial [Bacillota bacterium]
ISGAPVANVSTTGPFIIPLMKQVGYSPEVAAGIIGAAGTGGTILPPIMGAAAFIMAELTGIPYGKIIVAAALPALLYYLGVFLCVDLEAGRTGMRGLPPSELPSLREGLRHSLLFAVPLGVLVFLITVAKVSPLRAGLWGIAAIIATNLLLGPDRLRWPQVIRAFEGAARGTIIVTVAIAVSGIVVGAINQTGLGLKLTELLVLLAEDSTFLLLVGAALAGLVVGFPLPVTASYILLAAIAAPAIAQAGFSLMQAHLFIIYFAAFAPITPPVALASFAAAGIAEANPMTSSYVGWRYSLPAYIVPFMFMFGPELLLEGSWGQILLTVISSALGVFALSCCVVGWWGRPLAWWRRGLALAAALSLMWCGWQTDLVGAAILIAALGKVRFPLGRVSKVCQS